MPVRGEGMTCPPASLGFTSNSCHLGLPGAIQGPSCHLGPPGLVMAVPLDTIPSVRVRMMRRQQCLTSAALSCREVKLCLSTILEEP